MTRRATARAHPNIALAKYWGKQPSGANAPAVPSLSVTLEGMSTTTTVAFDDSLALDVVTLNGVAAEGAARDRVVTLLDRVRARAGLRERASVTTTNDFPTAAGLASSASGFAALAVAACAAAGVDEGPAFSSDLARRSSASAARSIFGGFVELPSGPASARVVAPPDHLDLRVVVAVTTERAKDVGSTAGMTTTADKSPFYRAWLEAAPVIFARVKAGVLARDLRAVGEAAEESALAMHASAIAAGVVYWNGATLDVLAEVRRMRADGLAAWATIDAGPHVKVITSPSDASAVRAALERTEGVLRVIEARPGRGAEVIA